MPVAMPMDMPMPVQMAMPMAMLVPVPIAMSGAMLCTYALGPTHGGHLCGAVFAAYAPGRGLLSVINSGLSMLKPTG